MVQWYSMRLVCIAGYFLKFSFKVQNNTWEFCMGDSYTRKNETISDTASNHVPPL